MSGHWWFALSAVVNAVSVAVYLLAVREQRRIDRARRKLRLERRGSFGEAPAGSAGRPVLW